MQINMIVRRLKAADLPEDLRVGINPAHTVEVTVTDLGEGRPQRSGQELLRELEEHVRKHGDTNATMEDAVRRVRELRDEWD